MQFLITFYCEAKQGVSQTRSQFIVLSIYPPLYNAFLIDDSWAAKAFEQENLKKQLSDCKSELRDINKTKVQLDSEIEDLRRDLDASNQEKAGLVNSKKILELELEETKKKLMQKSGQLEELEGKFNTFTLHRRPDSVLVARTHEISGGIQGACANPKSKEQGRARFPIFDFSETILTSFYFCMFSRVVVAKISLARTQHHESDCHTNSWAIYGQLSCKGYRI